jgi:hypothetical protein
MLLGLKHVYLTSTRQYQSKPHDKPYHFQESVFDLLTQLYGNGDVVGAKPAGMERRDVLNVLTGFMQPMRKGCIDCFVPETDALPNIPRP